MGACTITVTKVGVDNNKKVCEATVAMSASYATSGDTVAVNKINLRQVDELQVRAGTDVGTPPGYSVKLGGTATAPKVLVYNSAGQIASTTNLSAVSFPLRFLGS